jgi:hypothetical protein
MNAKMKVLALALLGLAGYAGSAAASCPSSPVPPWTANSPFQGTTTIAAGGLDGTACRLDASINAGATGFASALVQDDTPTAEPRYRAQFMIDTSGLTPATPGFTDAVTVFQAISATTGNGISLAIFGDGTQWLLSYTIVDANDPSGYFSNSTPLPNSPVHVEFDLPVSGSADFKLWVEQNNEATPTLEHTPTNNSAITGIDTALLGLTGPSDSANGFVTHYNSQAVKFDRFDSRRSTFIGF